MISDSVVVSVISTVGGISIAYIANVLAKRRRQTTPTSRMDTIFDGYESLIKQQQLDIERKERQLDQSQTIIDRLSDELDQTKVLVNQMRAELTDSKGKNEELISQLEQMKETFGTKRHKGVK